MTFVTTLVPRQCENQQLFPFPTNTSDSLFFFRTSKCGSYPKSELLFPRVLWTAGSSPLLTILSCFVLKEFLAYAAPPFFSPWLRAMSTLDHVWSLGTYLICEPTHPSSETLFLTFYARRPSLLVEKEWDGPVFLALCSRRTILCVCSTLSWGCLFIVSIKPVLPVLPSRDIATFLPPPPPTPLELRFPCQILFYLLPYQIAYLSNPFLPREKRRSKVKMLPRL